MTRPVLCAERNGRLAESYLEGFPMEINLWSSLAASKEDRKSLGKEVAPSAKNTCPRDARI